MGYHGVMMMKLLLTNDDGIGAPGLGTLHALAVCLGSPVVVAPVQAVSGCSHRVTTDGPLLIEARGADRYAIHGTPADCVRVGLHRLAPTADWVLSGINAGGNLGADVWHSGTVAAAREAVLHGRPAVALSHYLRRGVPLDWGRAAGWSVPVLAELFERTWEPGTLWNINLPHLDPGAPDPEVVFCRLDPMPLPLSFRGDDDALHYDGDYHSRPRLPGTDVDVCFSGKIAVTRISLF
jgi:5'-nucleotidase